jgi:hypothetical protein
MNTQNGNPTRAENIETATTPTYRNERAILRATVSALLSAGYVVRMDDGEETSEPLTTPSACVEWCSWDDKSGGRMLWNLDDFYVRAERDGKGARVWFIVSNGNDGRDVVSDYSCSLESIMDPILSEFA